MGWYGQAALINSRDSGFVGLMDSQLVNQGGRNERWSEEITSLSSVCIKLKYSTLEVSLRYCAYELEACAIRKITR